MVRVFFGAVICGLVTAGVTSATLPWSLKVQIDYRSPATGTGSAIADVSPVAGRMGTILLGCAGALIGAIAGAVSSWPDSKPIPPWFLWTLLVIVLGLVLLVAVWNFVPSSKMGPNPEIEVSHPPVQDRPPQK
jgi:hypothetical protein